MEWNNSVMYFLYLVFLIFCIKNMWRLHTTYPKREVPLKAFKNLSFFERHFPGLSQYQNWYCKFGIVELKLIYHAELLGIAELVTLSILQIWLNFCVMQNWLPYQSCCRFGNFFVLQSRLPYQYWGFGNCCVLQNWLPFQYLRFGNFCVLQNWLPYQYCRFGNFYVLWNHVFHYW